MDTLLQLGDFVFEGMEVPEVLALGGAQTLVKHNFPGGARAIQAMGADHAPIAWRGLMLGGTAFDRAKALDYMRVQGAPLPLTVFNNVYTVVIARFEYLVERFYKVGYSITVEVISDDTQPVEVIPPTSFDTQIGMDCDTMMGLSGSVGDSVLSGAINAVSAAVRQVSSFAAAPVSTIAGVLGGFAAVNSRVNVLKAGVESVLGSSGSIGGVVPNTPLPQTIATAAAQVLASQQYPVLLNIGSLSQRAARNVSMANQQTSLRTVQVAGGTLFDVAVAEYGDATRWPAIAQASKLTDVVLSGVKTLTIPARPVNSGGVPTQ